MQIQISWLLKKPTDLDLHCLLRQGMSCSAREGLNSNLFGKIKNLKNAQKILYYMVLNGKFCACVTFYIFFVFNHSIYKVKFYNGIYKKIIPLF